MNILIVEDDPRRIAFFEDKFRGHELYITKLPWQAIDFLALHNFDLILLDHDLGDELLVDSGPGTGWMVAKAIEMSRLKSLSRTCGTIIIHTMNTIGAVNMARTLGMEITKVLPFPRIVKLSEETTEPLADVLLKG